MDDSRICTACRANLVGPFQPKITLTHPVPDEEAKIAARAWVCSGCGLLHWYVDDESFELLATFTKDESEATPTPGEEYERRAQMLRMLRRVRRM